MHLFTNIPDNITTIDELSDEITKNNLRDFLTSVIGEDDKDKIHLREVLKYYSPVSEWEEIDKL